GRVDDQIKLHGYRIELGEIEGTLRAQRGVRDAVVRAFDDPAGGKHLVAYVVPQRPNQALWGWQAPYVLPDGAPVAHLNRNETEYIYNEIFVQQAYLRHGITIREGDSIVDRLRARTVAARLRTLSSVIAEEGIERIDLLKVNVEKSELDVLRGIDADDWPKIRQAVIEVDQHDHVEPITQLLERHGFDVMVEQDPLLRDTELCYVYAIRPSPERGGLIRHQPADAFVRAELPADGEVLTPASLRKHLQARLPQYMIPSAFVLLDKLPLTANGKVDRQALPAVSFERGQPAHELAAPLTETEQA